MENRFSVQDYLEKNIQKHQNTGDYLVKYKFHQETDSTNEECTKLSSNSVNPSILECKDGDEIITTIYGTTNTFYKSHKSKEECIKYINPILSLLYSNSFDINRNELNSDKIEIGINYMYPVSSISDININTSKIQENINKKYFNSNSILHISINSNILPYSEEQFQISRKHYNILHQYVSDEISNNLPLNPFFCNSVIIIKIIDSSDNNEKIKSIYYDDNLGINIIPISNDYNNENIIEEAIEKHLLKCMSIKYENKEILLQYPTMINDVIFHSLFRIYKNELNTYEYYLKDVKSKWFYISVPKDSNKILKEAEKILKEIEKESKFNMIKNMRYVSNTLYNLLYSPEFTIHQPSLPPYHIFALYIYYLYFIK